MKSVEDNFEEFLHAFNVLHDVIAKKVNKRPETNFGELLGTASKQKDKVIETYYDQINFYREFRNLLTHNTIRNEAIAQPSDALIDEIKGVTEKIRYNKKVKDLFLRKVLTIDEDDMLEDVLELVKKESYTQYPVFNGNTLVGIITSVGITNYLARHIDEDIISIKETSIKELLEVEEEQDFYEVVSKNRSIFDIEELFTKRIKEGRTAYVLLVSKNEKITSKNDLVGIITPWDIPKLVANK